VADDSTPSAPEEASESQATEPEAAAEQPAAAEPSGEPTEDSAEQPAPESEAEPSGEPTEDSAEQPAPESEAEASGEQAAAQAAPAESAAEPPKPARPPVTSSSAGTGRRKEAVARVRLVPGSGQFDLGGRTLEQVFPNRAHRMEITAPLRLVDHDQDVDVVARLTGGGMAGQAGALRHGIARALVELDPGLRPTLKAEGFLSRDSREKERRKYGLKKARKAPQYSKR